MDRARWIVVGTDFSPAAEQALMRAAALATDMGAALACTHAYEDPPEASPRSDPAAALMTRLEEAASRVRERFPRLTVECFVRRGCAWDKLANVACELGADMIVVGAAHCQASDASVLTRVAATSNRSVLVVPAHDAIEAVRRPR